MTVPTRSTTRLAAALLVAVSLTACSGGPQEDRVNAQSELAARPTSEQMISRYEDMLQLVRDRLDTELGPFDWFRIRDDARNGCGTAFPSELGGRTVTLAPWGFEAAIPDDQWPRAAQIVADTTAEYGFDTAGLQIDEPGRHTVNGVDTALGAHYRFGTQVNTSIQVTTGCHLPRTAQNIG